MYTFTIKDNGPHLDMVITRAMLTLSAIAALVYRSNEHYYLSLLAAFALLMAAIFIKKLLVTCRINKLVLLSAAAIGLFIATHSLAFALILLVYGYLVKFLYKKPTIQVTSDGINIKKLFSQAPYQWNEFSNIILKDNLLTLDFKNNKLVQVNIDESGPAVDENDFNAFCKCQL